MLKTPAPTDRERMLVHVIANADRKRHPTI
jgi:hypothetical protein